MFKRLIEENILLDINNSKYEEKYSNINIKNYELKKQKI